MLDVGTVFGLQKSSLLWSHARQTSRSRRGCRRNQIGGVNVRVSRYRGCQQMTATRRSHYSISPRQRSSRAQSGWPAHVGVAAQVESQAMIRGSSYAYPPAAANALGSPAITGQPKEAAQEEIGAIERSIDGKRATEPAGATTKIARALNGSAALHEREPLRRLEGANEHSCTPSFALARKIKAERRAVDLIDVDAMRRSKERRIAGAFAGRGVTRRIVRKVGFSLDDAARRHPILALTYENATEQGLCERFCLDRQNLRCQAEKFHAATFSATSAPALCINSSVAPVPISTSWKALSAQRSRT